MIEDKLNLTFYKGTDEYSDGDVEEEILKIVSSDVDYIESLKRDDSWPKLYHLSDVRHNLLRWYDFDASGTALEIGAGCGAVTGLLCEKLSKVTCIDLSKRRSMINATRNKEYDNFEIYVGNFTDISLDEKFDYVMLIGVLEYSIYYVGGDDPFNTMIKKAGEYLKPGGKLIIAIENKYGLKYFAGAKEDHTGKLFSGIENYVGVDRVRTFSRSGLLRLMENNGFVENKLYYPVSDYKMPTMVFSDEHLPARGDIRHSERPMDQDRLLLFNENLAFDSVCEDGLFPELSNSFLMISSKDEHAETNSPVFADFHSYRRREFQLSTIIYKDAEGLYVEKKPINHKADSYIDIMADNYEKIKNMYRNIELIPVQNKDKALIYRYVAGRSLDMILSDCLYDVDKLCDTISLYLAKIMDHSEEGSDVFSKGKLPDQFKAYDLGEFEGSKCARIADLGMDFEHIICSEDRLYGIGYEWVYDGLIPDEFVKYHLLYKFYSKYASYLKEKLGEKDFYARFVSEAYIDTFASMECTHREFIYGENEDNIYINNYFKNAEPLDYVLAKAAGADDLKNMVIGVEAQRDRCFEYRMYYLYRSIRKKLGIDKE